MKKSAKIITSSFLVVLFFITSGCATPEPASLNDQQVISLTENLLKALDANDYQNFTKDFSDKMIAAFPPDQVTALRAMLANASGKFISAGTPSLLNNQGYAVYRIPCKYENEDVTVSLVFLIEGQKVEGLFFDSANLRKSAQ